MTAADSILRAENIGMRFETSEGPVVAVDDLTLDVRQGEFLSIIGPSGCGKSTLLHLVAGLAQPSGGHIAWWNDAFDATGGEGRRIA